MYRNQVIRKISNCHSAGKNILNKPSSFSFVESALMDSYATTHATPQLNSQVAQAYQQVSGLSPEMENVKQRRRTRSIRHPV